MQLILFASTVQLSIESLWSSVLRVCTSTSMGKSKQFGVIPARSESEQIDMQWIRPYVTPKTIILFLKVAVEAQ